MKYLICLLFLFSLAACEPSSAAKKPSQVLPESLNNIKPEVANINEKAKDNKKAAKKIQDDPTPENAKTQAIRIDTNSDSQMESTTEITEQTTVIEKQVPVIKKIEKKAEDPGVVETKLLEFAGACGVAGIACILIFIFSPIKNPQVLYLAGVLFGLAVAALILKQYWDEFIFCASICLAAVSVYGCYLLYKAHSLHQDTKDVQSEIVNGLLGVIDKIKEVAPGVVSGVESEIAVLRNKIAPTKATT